ncbi:pre-peptidase C-terminal domain-containing protein [Aquimarina sp. 2-A2]|uniref:PPC domain-containing protein n=1 Tax=Aquimarina sp. 2-A2 TaxID=3382644 RepID=UPI00387F0D8F
MTKFLHYLSFCMLISIFTASCSKDDEFVNTPPSKVGAIQAERVEGTMVNISWKASSDPDGDKLTYNVIINGEVVGSKVASNSIDFDTAPLLSNKTSNKSYTKADLLKGVTLELTIQIKANDGNGGVSEEVTSKQSVVVNRNPSEFSFRNVFFDTSSYNYLYVSWSLAEDIDGDQLSYDVYLNETLIQENYSVPQSNIAGEVYFYENYEHLMDDEIIVKVVAKDDLGGNFEITESFTFRATDVNIGLVETSFGDSFDFTIDEDELDNKIGFSFEIAETLDYSFISSVINSRIILRDEEGSVIASSDEGRIVNTNLLAGAYYVEVLNNMSSDVSGSFYIGLEQFSSNDVDLETIVTPLDQKFNYSTIGQMDTRVRYSFTLNTGSQYTIETIGASYDTVLFLYDSLGNLIQSDDDAGVNLLSKMSGTLASGSYYIEVGGWSDQVGAGTLQIIMQ